MSETPSIPDSVSPDLLRGLLGKNLPESSTIPRLDFGGKYGAPCDLQFAISLLVAQSAEGVNIVQTMVAAMHLLSEAQIQLDERLETLKSGSDPDLADAEPEVRQAVIKDIGENCAALNSAVVCLERVISGMAPYACHHRIRHLIDTGELAHGVSRRLELLSKMLISREVLDSLSLTRKQVTNYLENQEL